MDANPLPRPRQVTLAGWLIMVGSVFVVATVFERIAGLQSLEAQREAQRFLSEPPGEGLGVGVQGWLDIVRTVSMVAAGCAAAAGVLGFHVLRRNRGARLALAVLALPLFVTGLVAGGFMSSVVAASAVMLWFQPSRDWFNGVQARPAASPLQRSAPHATPAPPSLHRGPEGQQSQLSPTIGWLLDRSGKHTVDQAGRPPAVVAACALAFAFALVAAVLAGALLVALTSAPDQIFSDLRERNPDLAELSDGALRASVRLIGGLMVLWSLAVMVMSLMAFRGSRGPGWAWSLPPRRPPSSA